MTTAMTATAVCECKVDTKARALACASGAATSTQPARPQTSTKKKADKERREGECTVASGVRVRRAHVDQLPDGKIEGQHVPKINGEAGVAALD